MHRGIDSIAIWFTILPLSRSQQKHLKHTRFIQNQQTHENAHNLHVKERKVLSRIDFNEMRESYFNQN